MYHKSSHRVIFYLNFFLRLLELEHHVIVSLLQYNEKENDGSNNTNSNSDPASSSSSAGANNPANPSSSAATGSASSSSGNNTNNNVNTEAPPLDLNELFELSSLIQGPSFSSAFSSDNVSSFQAKEFHRYFGRESAEELLARIVDAPLEYVRKKVDACVKVKPEKNSTTQAAYRMLFLLDVLETLNTLLPKYRIILKKVSAHKPKSPTCSSAS